MPLHAVSSEAEQKAQAKFQARVDGYMQALWQQYRVGFGVYAEVSAFPAYELFAKQFRHSVERIVSSQIAEERKLMNLMASAKNFGALARTYHTAILKERVTEMGGEDAQGTRTDSDPVGDTGVDNVQPGTDGG